jgi:phosphoribosylformylglycinamidine synthase PurS subunit
VRHHFGVVVRLNDGLLDPQGKAIEDSLPHMGWTNVSNVRVGKLVELDVEAADVDRALEQVQEIAAKLLSNPVIESVSVIRGTFGSGMTLYEPLRERSPQ